MKTKTEKLKFFYLVIRVAPSSLKPGYLRARVFSGFVVSASLGQVFNSLTANLD
jgi:hypothetical protein